MLRVSQQEIERVKREVSIQNLVEAYGVKLKQHGKDLVGLCPFHPDKDPSLVISPDKNLYHCLGACQSGGSVIDWVMQAERVSFLHAVELLRSDYTPNPKAKRPPKRSLEMKLPQLVKIEAKDQEILGRVIGFYHDTLKQSPEALAYLKLRGLSHPDIIDHFKLGYSNRTLGYRLPRRPTREGAIRDRLQELGIFRKTGHEHFTGRLVIPVFDEQVQVTELYGRLIGRLPRKGTPYHLYLPGPHRGVWNIEALGAYNEIIVCEALIDALTFWCAGYRNVTSSYGIEGFTDDHLKAFKRYAIERVLLAYDRDKAGDKAAESLAEKLMAEGITCYRIQFPKGMDANEYALNITPAEKSLGIVIRKAMWMGKGQAPSIQLGQGFPVALAKDDAGLAAKEEKPSSSPLETKQPLATPEPPAPSVDVPTEVKTTEVVIRLGDRRYRVRNLAKNTGYGTLKVNLLVASGDHYFVDTFDLYAARHRVTYIKQAARELEVKQDVVKKDLGKVLLKLEELQDAQIRKALEPEKKAIVLSEEDKAAAVELLKAPDLLERILDDFRRCGVVGEQTNKLLGYLACVSRKLEEPLAVIFQSSSAAGKSSLMETILSLMPPEEFSKYSAMTGQSLFYMGEADLRHKILAIVEEEGAERASYALKLLQSEGELTIASTGKDPHTGRLVTHEYRVEGPVAILLTTTAIEIDEELLNRCIVLTIDEEREQTRAIHRTQRAQQTLDGLLARRERKESLKLHQNAQRLLKPLLVANPYAEKLTFLDIRTRTRRDHMKYLTLIRSIALLCQYQRQVKSVVHRGKAVEYIEVTKSDIAIANHLAHEVLGRSLDELPPQTRRLLELLDEMVKAACEKLSMDRCDYRFSRREIRNFSSFSYDQVRIHLSRLVELEYVLVHRGGRGQCFVYELLYDGKGKDGRPVVMGLIDLDGNENGGTTKSLEGKTGQFGGPFDPQMTPIWPRLGSAKTTESPNNGNEIRQSSQTSSKNAYIEDENGKNKPNSRGRRHPTSLRAADSAAEVH